MITITTNQALVRWDTLPMVLREALYSEPNSDFLWKTCEAENVPDEKIYDVARIAGYVLMGFLHPEDMAEELKEQLGLDPRVCASVASAINQRVFAPLRQHIDKVYEPLSKVVGAAPLAVNQSVAVPPPSVPTPKPKLPDVGWSKFAPGQPSPPIASPPPKPASPAEPAPIILHEDAAFKPQQKTPDFRIQLPMEKFDVQKSAGQPTVKPVVLEFGSSAAQPPAAPPPRVVHYTEYKPPVSGAPLPVSASKQSPRQVIEITSPPSPPKDKVIYKDYSEPAAAQAPKAPPPPPKKLI